VEQNSIGLILDCSASMWNKLEDGRYRIDAAKDVLIDFLTNTEARPGLNIGLRIYGSKVHFSKNGACQDSVLVVPIDGFEREKMIAEIRRARTIGATPLARSLELAVADFTKPGKRRLIVCTDGEESCGGDVRAAIEALRAAGVEVDLRFIGIGLPQAAAERFEAMGVPVINVNTTQALAAALNDSAAEVAPPAPAPETAAFTVKLVKNGAPLVGNDVTFTHALTGDAIELTATDEGVFTGKATPGSYTATVTPAERLFEGLAVVAGGENLFVLDLTEAPSVAIEVSPKEVMGGENITVKFSGAAGLPEEWIGFAQAEEGAERPRFWIVSNGQESGEMSTPAPAIPGEYRATFYTWFNDQNVAAGTSEPFLVKAPKINLVVPAKVVGGSIFPVRFTAPEIQGAWIGFCPADAPDGDYIQYSRVEARSGEMNFEAPSEPGDYEVRFHGEVFSEPIGRAKFQITAPEFSLEAPESAMAGSMVTLTWKAPKSDHIYITLVMADSEEGQWEEYGTTSAAENPLVLRAPREVGSGEIRIFSNLDAKTLFRRPIQLTEMQATIEAPATATTNAEIPVKWTGPGGSGDYLTLVTAESPDDVYQAYIYASEAGEGTFTAPETPGSYEIRYVTGSGGVVARSKIEVR
jgi:Ca-activated chloride channel family protein